MSFLHDSSNEMDLDKFVAKGYLQEVNRRFLHPLGIALMAHTVATGKVIGLSVRQADDPGGIMFAAFSAPDVYRGQEIDADWDRRIHARMKDVGFMVQPLVEGTA